MADVKSPSLLDTRAGPSLPDQPPSYEAQFQGRTHARPESSVTSSPRPSLANDIDFLKYIIVDSSMSADKTTLTCTFPEYTSNPRLLASLLRDQAKLPPKPLLCIKGTHHQYNSEYAPKESDFDLTLNMMPLLAPAGADPWFNVSTSVSKRGDNRPLSSICPGGMNQSAKAEIDLAVKRFCAGPSETQSIVLERTVKHWDTAYLEGAIRTMIAKLDYRGEVQITFPVQHSKLVIKRGMSAKNWFKKLAPTPVFETVEVAWSYANVPSGDETGEVRKCVGQTERAWWQDWQLAVRNCILAEKKSAWVSNEDWIEAQMGLKVAGKGKAWGT